jgi:Reverse transcriptase (RNA-dependent DNA polymerase)/RNase H-like domain found in reverse transcriptase/Retroviral aspartyl protease
MFAPLIPPLPFPSYTKQSNSSTPIAQQWQKRFANHKAKTTLPQHILKPKSAHLSSANFHHLQTVTGDAFSADVSPPVKNFSPRCTTSVTADTPLQGLNLQNHHLWAELSDATNAESTLNHINQEWRKPNTQITACVVLPASLSYAMDVFDGVAQLVKRYPKRSRIMVHDETGKPTYNNQELHAYMIGPCPTLTTLAPRQRTDLLVDSTGKPLAFTFQADCKTVGQSSTVKRTSQARAMIDSGASARFASAQWVKEHKIPIRKSHCNWTVKVANNDTVQVSGSIDLTIKIGSYTDKIRFLVIDMTTSFDLILGTDWMLKREVILDYGKQTATIHHLGLKHVLTSKQTTTSTLRKLDYPNREDINLEEEEANNILLTHAQAKRHLRSRDDWQVIEIHHVDGSDTWDEEDFEQVNAAKAKAQPPNPEKCEQDVQKAIDELKQTLTGLSPSDTTMPPLTQEEQALSDKLDESIKLKIDEFGDSVFRENLPGIRQQGDPIEAIPIPPGSKPPTRGLGRYSKQDKEEIDKQIADLLSKGLIEPSLSPYAAAALIVPKYNPDGTIKGWRMVIDYRLLNAITVKYQFPMPRIDDVLDSLNGAKYFSACDATWGFWQLRLMPSDVPKTAFKTPSGLYQWRVLPFGLSNSPAIFQRTMSSFFQKAYTNPDGTVVTALGSFIQVYMDDLLIYSRTPEEHLAHLDFVFCTLRENQIFLNPKKCEFNKASVRFLGHFVSRHGVRPDPAKVSVMKDWPVPTDSKELYRFIGFANYFRQFIRNYATIASPLYPLTQCKGKPAFQEAWTTLQQSCFEALKLSLSHAPTMKMPDFDQPFEVIVDASNVAVGAVLIQDKRPVAYESKKLSPAEQKWTTTERELFAAVHALRQWRCYLQHPTHKFTLWTDHNPNIFFSTTNRPLTPRQARWQEFLGPFNFEWKYKKGPDNIADALSRLPDEVYNALDSVSLLYTLGTSAALMTVQTRAAKRRAESAQQDQTKVGQPSSQPIQPTQPAHKKQRTSQNKAVAFKDLSRHPGNAKDIQPERQFKRPLANFTSLSEHCGRKGRTHSSPHIQRETHGHRMSMAYGAQ